MEILFSRYVYTLFCLILHIEVQFVNWLERQQLERREILHYCHKLLWHSKFSLSKHNVHMKTHETLLATQTNVQWNECFFQHCQLKKEEFVHMTICDFFLERIQKKIIQTEVHGEHGKKKNQGCRMNIMVAHLSEWHLQNTGELSKNNANTWRRHGAKYASHDYLLLVWAS